MYHNFTLYSQINLDILQFTTTSTPLLTQAKYVFSNLSPNEPTNSENRGVRKRMAIKIVVTYVTFNCPVRSLCVHCPIGGGAYTIQTTSRKESWKCSPDSNTHDLRSAICYSEAIKKISEFFETYSEINQITSEFVFHNST